MLVQVAQGEAGIRAQAERHRRRKAPAMTELLVAPRHVLGVAHRVQAHRGAVFEVVIAVGSQPAIAVAAATDHDVGEVALAGGLGDQIDVAADRAGAGHRRVGAVDQLYRFQVEGVAAAVLRAVAHAIGGDVAAGGEAAQVDAVAIATAAFAGAEGDAGQGAERIAQRQQVLLVHGLLGDHGDRLRRVAQHLGVLGRGRLLRAFLLHPDGVQIDRARRRWRIARLGEGRSGQRQQHGRGERGNPGSHEASRRGKRGSGLAMARQMREGKRIGEGAPASPRRPVGPTSLLTRTGTAQQGARGAGSGKKWQAELGAWDRRAGQLLRRPEGLRS